MSIQTTREQRRQLARDNDRFGPEFVEIPRDTWSGLLVSENRLRVWRNREFLVQEFKDDNPLVLVRLSINRTQLSGIRWKDGISWDEMQGIKDRLGYYMHDAVEIMPRLMDVVNVANMRHLWVLRDLLPYAWRRG